MKNYCPYREDLTLEQARPPQLKGILSIYTNKALLNGYEMKGNNQMKHTGRNLTISTILLILAFYACYVI